MPLLSVTKIQFALTRKRSGIKCFDRSMKTNCGTTIFSLVTKYGIAIGADSMARHRDGHEEIFDKLHVVRESVIACEGLGILKACNKRGATELVATERTNGWRKLGIWTLVSNCAPTRGQLLTSSRPATP